MRECKMAKKWRILILAVVFMFAVPVAGLVQEPIQAEAAAPKLNKKKASVKEGKTITLTVKNPTAKVKWSSSNSQVVKIMKKSGAKSSKVTLKGMKKGTSTITAKVGKKKLKAKVTVKHVHRFVPATCTKPETCTTCGATRGSYLGHDKVDATCQAGAYCKRCKAKLSDVLPHDYRSGYCTMCGKLDLPHFVSFSLPDAGLSSSPFYHIEVSVKKSESYALLEIGHPGVPGDATGILTGSGIGRRSVLLENYDYYEEEFYLINGLLCSEGSTLTDGAFYFFVQGGVVLPRDATVQFDIKYRNAKVEGKYLVTVGATGFTYEPYYERSR